MRGLICSEILYVITKSLQGPSKTLGNKDYIVTVVSTTIVQVGT